MKIARYRDAGGEGWASIVEDAVYPLVGSFEDWVPAITRDGPDAAPVSSSAVSLTSVKLLAPIAPTTRVFGTGINYRSHTDIAGQPNRANAAPCFMVPLSAMIGPDEQMRYPDIRNQFDYEIELVCVMGT